MLGQWKISTYSKRLVWVTFVICYVAAVIIAVFLVITTGQALGSDFVSFLTGASLIRGGEGKHLYEFPIQLAYQQRILQPFNLNLTNHEVKLLPYLNLPVFALLYIPFTYMPFLIAYKLYVILLAGVLFIIGLVASRIFSKLSIYSAWPFIPLVFYPSIGAVFIGQTSVFLVLLFLLLFLYLRQGKYFQVGILSSLLFLKIQYAIAIPYLFILSRDKKNFSKGLVISAVIIIILNLWLSGFFLNEYFSFLVATQKPEFGLRDRDMFTFFAYLRQTQPFSLLNFYELFLVNIFFYIITLVFLFKNHEKLSLENNFIVVTILTLVFSIHGVNYDLALLLVPIFIIVNRIRSGANLSNTDRITIFTLVFLPALFLIGKGVFIPFILIGVTLLLITQQAHPRRLS